MAKPNYSFEKRQRELAKKKKKEEKLKEKAGRKVGEPGGDDAPADDDTVSGAPPADAPVPGP
ncbi:MAG TPA: hypothetical protein VNU48_14275 [Burkholderiaceae bacterium]|nr:hypothetical protein [Burkholderiaceae bacterium]